MDRISAINYFGGKKPMLDWLLPLMNVPHSHFIDLFGGSAAVLLNKKPANLETYNDINGEVVNLFKVLRDSESGDELIKRLQLSPYSREDYYASWNCQSDDPIERARCFFIRSMQSHGSSGAQASYNGWSFTKSDWRNKVSQSVARYLDAINGLPEVIYRLRGVQIENRDFREIIEKYRDAEGLLVYMDPPYPIQSRSSSKRYRHEMKDSDHEELFNLINDAKFKWCLSTYNCDLMDRMYAPFFKTESRLYKTNGKQTFRQEVVYTNYEPCGYANLFN